MPHSLCAGTACSGGGGGRSAGGGHDGRRCPQAGDPASTRQRLVSRRGCRGRSGVPAGGAAFADYADKDRVLAGEPATFLLMRLGVLLLARLHRLRLLRRSHSRSPRPPSRCSWAGRRFCARSFLRAELEKGHATPGARVTNEDSGDGLGQGGSVRRAVSQARGYVFGVIRCPVGRSSHARLQPEKALSSTTGAIAYDAETSGV